MKFSFQHPLMNRFAENGRFVHNVTLRKHAVYYHETQFLQPFYFHENASLKSSRKSKNLFYKSFLKKILIVITSFNVM